MYEYVWQRESSFTDGINENHYICFAHNFTSALGMMEAENENKKKTIQVHEYWNTWNETATGTGYTDQNRVHKRSYIVRWKIIYIVARRTFSYAPTPNASTIYNENVYQRAQYHSHHHHWHRHDYIWNNHHWQGCHRCRCSAREQYNGEQHHHYMWLTIVAHTTWTYMET